ncbi:MAG: hypothetical protein ABSC34_05315, partial [Acidimicrobiales bacterium]
MLDLLGDFIAELRAAGIPVSMSEHVDAARAVEVIDLGQRSMVRGSLAATLVKDGDHLPVFYSAFDVFFATRSWRSAQEALEDPDLDGELAREGGAAGTGQLRGLGGGSSSSLSAQELAELLFRALRDNNADALRDAASEAVTRYAGMEPGRPVGGTYYLYRTLRSLDLEQLEARLSAVSLAKAATEDELAQRISRDDARDRVEKLKAEIERVIRERLVDDRGASALAKSVRRPLPEDLDVMHANRDEMAQLERALRPLSRKLATRLARKRRRRRR